MKRLSLVLLFVCFISSSAFASIVFNGPIGSWCNATLWDKGIVPNDTEEIKLTGADDMKCTISCVQPDYTNKIAIARGTTLEVVVNGYIGCSADFKVGDAGATGNGSDIGYLVMSGGQINSTSKFIVGYKATGEGYVTISGGSLTGGGKMYVGGNNATGAKGTFTVVGSAATISVSDLYVGADSSSGGHPGNGTIEFQIGSAGVSPIGLSGTAYLDPAGASSTATLVLSLLAAPPSEADITLITGTAVGTFDSVVDDGGDGTGAEGSLVKLSFGGNDYFYNLTYTGSVVLQYVPEPATMLLLGLGGLFVARRKK